MTDRERFKAICHGEKPDYVPIFGLAGAPGMSNGCQTHTRNRLIEGGMPESVGANHDVYGANPNYSWQRYWGTTSPIYPSFGVALAGKGIACEVREEDGWEIYEWESGAKPRQLLDNDNIYTMPEFQSYHVRDRKSWEFYRDRSTPAGLRPEAEIAADVAAYDSGDRPRGMYAGGTWGSLRGIMGPETGQSTVLYDDPALAQEMFDTQLEYFEKYTAPLIERLRPDVIQAGEDNCYNHGMFISPKHFRQYCAPYYRRVAEVAKDCGVDMVAVDTDGNAMELVGLLEECGVNALFPCEVKAGNDLFKLRREHPSFIFLGGLEKEVVNEGNGHMIAPEIMSKVPPLLEKGHYFPNGDHGLQPLNTFEGMCRFMTLLHEVSANPEGEFPRMK